MKKFFKVISLSLVFSLVMAIFTAMGAGVYATALDDASVVCVGEGGTYANFTNAISGLGANLEGKTLYLVSDVTEPGATRFNYNCTIEGNGYTANINNSMISQSLTTDYITVTINNLKVIPTRNAGITAISCRTYSNLILNNVEVNFIGENKPGNAVGLNAGGNCDLTINSGYYTASTAVINAGYNNTVQNTITVNGGIFETSGSGYIMLSGGTTDVTVNGGLFINRNGNKPVFRSQQGKTERSLNIDVKGGAFFSGTGSTFYTASGSADNITFDFGTDAALFKTLTADGDGETGTNYVTVSEGTPVDTDAEIILKDNTVLEGALVKALDNISFDGAVVKLSKDCDRTIDFAAAALTVEKNGHKADGVTSQNGVSVVRDGISGARAYVQFSKNPADNPDSLDARIVIGLSYSAEEISSVGMLFSTSAITDTANTGEYKNISTSVVFGQIIADGETVLPNALGGTEYVMAVAIRNITSANYASEIYFVPYVVEAESGNTVYGECQSFSVSEFMD